MSKFQITDAAYDEDVLASKKRVRVGTSGEISFETPLRVGQDNVKDTPIYEAYRNVKIDTLEKCLRDTSFDANYSRELKNLRSKGFTILTLGYGSIIDPSPKQIAIMADLQYISSDVVVIPSWYDLINKSDRKLEKYLKHSKEFKAVAETLNNKPMVAAIPQCMPPVDLEAVIKHWMDENVVSYIVDSSARTPLGGTWMRNLKREINRYSVEKESLLYSINAYQCSVQKNTEVAVAKDFLGFNTAFDMIGGKHVAKGSSESYKNVSGESKGKLFDQELYSYHNLKCTKEQAAEYKEKSIIRQIAEMGNVRNNIKEGVKMTDLLRSKSINAEIIKTFVDFKNEVEQKGRVSKLDAFI